MRRNRRMTYRPSKSQAVFGGVVGILFVLIAVGITGMNFYQAFGKSYVGPEIRIEEDGAEEQTCAPASPQARLEQLRALYDQRLITQEEYEQKRKEILNEL